jgi:chromosome segregation ATPase
MGQIFDDYRRVTNELVRVNGLLERAGGDIAAMNCQLANEREKVKVYQDEVRKRDEPINLARQTERQRFEEALKTVTDEREAFRARAEEAQRLEEKVKRQDGQIKRLKAELRAALAYLSKEAK